jgi:hypothetical protein
MVGCVTTQQATSFSTEIQLIPGEFLHLDTTVFFGSTAKGVNGVVVLDGGIRLGKDIRHAFSEMKDSLKTNTIVYYVSHPEYSRSARRRDFIPETMDTLNSGYVNFKSKLDSFMRVETSRSTISNWTLVGHSLSGLYALKELHDTGSLINNVIALSPSLWVDHYSYFNYSSSSNISSYTASSITENLNRINTGLTRFKVYASNQNLKHTSEMFNQIGHNSYVKNAMKSYLLADKL